MDFPVYIVELISFPLLVAQLLLNCWADMPPEYQGTEIPEANKIY
jgi:hypothetical protein